MNVLGTISEILLEHNVINHQNNFTSKEYMLKKKIVRFLENEINTTRRHKI